MKWQKFTFLVAILSGLRVGPTIGYDIFQGREFWFNVPDTYAGPCIFTAFFVKSNSQEGTITAYFDEKHDTGQNGQFLYHQDIIERPVQLAAHNPIVKITTNLDCTATLQVSCGTDDPSKLTTAQLIPTTNWGTSYTLVFPGPMDTTCATVSLLSKLTTTITLHLTGRHKFVTDSVTQVVALDDGTAYVDDGRYTLHVTAEKRFQITASYWDMTGSKMESTDPFSVMYGPKNTALTQYACRSPNLMMEQMIPNYYWGLTYSIPKLINLNMVVRIVTLDLDTTVFYNIGIPTARTLPYPSDNFYYSLQSGNIVESTKQIMVYATFNSPLSGGGYCFSHVAPVSYTPLNASLVYVANFNFAVLISMNRSCTLQTLSGVTNDPYTDAPAATVQDTYTVQYLEGTATSSHVLERFHLTGGSAVCLSGITGLVVSQPIDVPVVMAARSLGFTSCPLGTNYSDPARQCELPTSEEDLTTSPATTAAPPYTTEADITTTRPEQTSSVETPTESITEAATTTATTLTNSPGPVVSTALATATVTAAAVSETATTGDYDGVGTTLDTAGQSFVPTASQTTSNVLSMRVSSDGTLQCPCSCLFSTLSHEEQLKLSKKRVKEILQRLLVQKDTLLRSKLKLKSARDWRPSSVTFGASGIAFLVSTFGLIVCADLCIQTKSTPRVCSR